MEYNILIEKIETSSDLGAHVAGELADKIKRVTANKNNTETFIVFKTDQDAMDAFNYLITTKLYQGVCLCSLCDLSENEPAVGFER